MSGNARFWIWWRGGWVKLTIKPWGEIRIGYSEPHDEGYSYERREYYYDPCLERIELTVNHGGKDCDGPLNVCTTCYAKVKSLKANDCFDEDDNLLNFRQPEWVEVNTEVEDERAQQAGY